MNEGFDFVNPNLTHFISKCRSFLFCRVLWHAIENAFLLFCFVRIFSGWVEPLGGYEQDLPHDILKARRAVENAEISPVGSNPVVGRLEHLG